MVIHIHNSVSNFTKRLKKIKFYRDGNIISKYDNKVGSYMIFSFMLYDSDIMINRPISEILYEAEGYLFLRVSSGSTYEIIYNEGDIHYA